MTTPAPGVKKNKDGTVTYSGKGGTYTLNQKGQTVSSSPTNKPSTGGGTSTGTSTSGGSSGGGTSIKYKPTTSTTPVYGEKSDAVKTLQQQLNAMGAGLKVDAMYGPLTQAAVNKYMGKGKETTTQTTPTTGKEYTGDIDEYKTEASKYMSMQDKAYTDLQSTLEKLQTGTLKLAPEEKQYLNAMQESLKQVSDMSQKATVSEKAAMETASMRMGLTKYSPEFAAQRVRNVVNEGASRLQQLNTQANLAIAQFQMGIREGRIKDARQAYSDFTSAQKDRFSTLQSIYTAVSDHEKEMRDYDMELQKFALEKQKYAAQEIKNRINQGLDEVKTSKLGIDITGDKPLVIARTDNKIKTLDKLLQGGVGLKASAGAWKRGALIDKNEIQDWRADIINITQKLTLDELGRAKTDGITFGALSDSERQAIGDAASALNSAMVFDKNGRPTGRFKMSEEKVLEELEKIKDGYAIDFERRIGISYEDYKKATPKITEEEYADAVLKSSSPFSIFE